MGKSIQALNNEIRKTYLEMIERVLTEAGEEVLRVPTSEASRSKNYNIAIPVLDSENNEKALVISLSVPTGARKTGEPYDPYEQNKVYLTNVEEQENKEKARAEKKAREEAERERKRKAKETIKTMKKDVQGIFNGE